MNARAKQGFISVNVADARHDLLIQQAGLDCEFARSKSIEKIHRVNRQRIWTEPLPMRFKFGS
jgi:hypothetical protein